MSLLVLVYFLFDDTGTGLLLFDVYVGSVCWNYGLGPFILINTIKEFKAHY